MEESTGSIQCVGKLEITQPTKTAGFICGSLPVPTDFSLFHSSTTPAAVLVPSPSPPPHTVGAPQYQMLPNETDLNTLPPVLSDDSTSEKLFPTFDAKSSNEEPHWGPVHQNLSRKCEALAVTGLTEYGDELDVVAPTDILKQIFKIPYSKAQLSITVHRVGDTLILNSGPGLEDGEKKIRRKNNQSKTSDPSILSNFAMHSVRAEACDCPPTHNPLSEKTSSTILPGTKSFVSSTDSQSNKSKLLEKNADKYRWGNKQTKKKNKKGMVKSSSEVGEKANCPVQDSDKFRRVGNDDFLRILFWQFHNFRMLLGSDMLIFSNEKYVAVSLHLWDVAKQVTPLTWLEAWLDNVMASVPEMAICYHDNGVVQGYELLKTDDIFLLKGISDDGVPAFHPQVVKQNGLSVLRFLQDNCKQDPGVYWLYKSAGEDVIQLYDLSVIPNNHVTDNHDKSHSFLPSLMHKGRNESIFSLGTLLYRVAHRLSLSKAFNNSTKSAKFFRKCLDFLRDQDHLVVRAYAHEQFARLILKCYEELDLTSETFLIESEVTVTDLDDESSEFPLEMFGSTVQNVTSAQIAEGAPTQNGSVVQSSDPTSSSCSNNNSVMMVESDSKDVSSLTSDTRDSLDMYYPNIVKHVTDPISSKLAAIHHVSQAIKSLRWKRQIQNTQEHLGDHGNIIQDEHPKFSLCACGDTNCIEVCDIREWLPKSKLDQKMWNLILLLGESYLALGDAYKEDGQLNKALKVVELACLVYGSMPQHLENTHFVSSMVDTTSSLDPQKVKNGICLEDYSKAYLFWAKAWSLVGDVYVEWYYKRVEISVQIEGSTQGNGIRMSNEVVREVTRLKRKLGQHKQNCSSCSLMNCSCQSDRVSSGNSASGSSSSTNTRKQSKKSNIKKNSSQSPMKKIVDNDKPNSEDKKSHDTQTTSVATTVNHKDMNKLDSDNSVKEPESNSNEKNASGLRNGGIFKFLGNLKYSDTETNLSDAIFCYDAARKAVGAYLKESPELHSIIKKMGWVFNELGRFRLECKNLVKAEFAFADAIKAFKEVSDYTNIILINCNLGHGRRALAEELVAKMDEFKQHEFLKLAWRQTMKAAKMEYVESLKFYGAAKMELTSAVNLPNYSELYNEVLTQFANTHLRLGMLLAKVATSTEDIDVTSSDEISASDSFREALVAYESLGDLRKQEAAFTHYHLACHHRDTCLKYLDFDRKHVELSTYETSRQRAKRYANLADRHWQKSIDFYRPKTHSDMFLNVIIEQSALSWSLANTLNSNTKMGAALLRLLEGRHVAESNESVKLWNQLQTLLKSMLATSLSNPNRAAESRKLKEMYRMSLKSTSLEQLHQIYELWVS